MRRSLAIIAIAPLIAAIAACADAPTGPGELLLGDETEAAFAAAEDLPTLPKLVERVRAKAGADLGDEADDALGRAGRLWRDADQLASPVRVRAARERAYAEAVPHLAAFMGESDRRQAARDLRDWIATASALLSGHAIAEIERALADAESLLRDVDRAERAGEPRAAVERLLRAADLLRATTPPAVARRLIADAERARAEWHDALNGSGADDDDDLGFRRADRLLDGARHALDDGDVVRAIQRAYYAGQLLGTR